MTNSLKKVKLSDVAKKCVKEELFCTELSQRVMEVHQR